MLRVRMFLAIVLLVINGSDIRQAYAADPWVPPFHNSSLKASKSIDSDEQRVVLSALKKINGFWTSEVEMRFAGKLNAYTYLIPSGYKPPEVMDYYEDSLKRFSYRAKYRCQGRDCGSSDRFASHVFKRRELLASDDDQHYRVGEFDFDGKSYVFILYGVVRGNKKVYVYVAYLEKYQVPSQSISQAEEALMTVFNDGLAYPMYVDEGTSVPLKREQTEVLDDIVRLLGQRESLKLFIVGHRFGSQSLEWLRNASLSDADTIRDYLVKAGVDNERLDTFGLGPLSPGAGKNRVELLINKYGE